jgi:putative ABC transport system permease protein
MRKWLQSFAYRTNITMAVFLTAFLSTVFITLLTISFQTIKTAGADPVRVLKDE